MRIAHTERIIMRTYLRGDVERDLLSLPARLGGMGLTNPTYSFLRPQVALRGTFLRESTANHTHAQFAYQP